MSFKRTIALSFFATSLHLLSLFGMQTNDLEKQLIVLKNKLGGEPPASSYLKSIQVSLRIAYNFSDTKLQMIENNLEQKLKKIIHRFNQFGLTFTKTPLRHITFLEMDPIAAERVPVVIKIVSDYVTGKTLMLEFKTNYESFGGGISLKANDSSDYNTFINGLETALTDAGFTIRKKHNTPHLLLFSIDTMRKKEVTAANPSSNQNGLEILLSQHSKKYTKQNKRLNVLLKDELADSIPQLLVEASSFVVAQHAYDGNHITLKKLS